MARPRAIIEDKTKTYCTCGKQYKEGYSKDSDGWWVCASCRKPSILTMNECDVCGNKFRGVKQSLKFAYTCPSCDR